MKTIWKYGKRQNTEYSFACSIFKQKRWCLWLSEGSWTWPEKQGRSLGNVLVICGQSQFTVSFSLQLEPGILLLFWFGLVWFTSVSSGPSTAPGRAQRRHSIDICWMNQDQGECKKKVLEIGGGVEVHIDKEGRWTPHTLLFDTNILPSNNPLFSDK